MSTSSQRSPRPAQLPALTAIRGPLAWLVVAFHFGDLEPFRSAIGGVKHPPLCNGPFAVDCFFVLSGFILFHVHPSLGRRLAWPEIREFLWLRLARIYPIHLAMLFVFVLCVEGLSLLLGVAPNAPERFSFIALIEHLLLLHGWGITDKLTWNYPSWSISSEGAAYLLAPAMFWLALRLRGLQLVILTAFTMLAISLVLANGEPSLRMALPRVLFDFLAGVLVCRLRDLHEARLRRVRLRALLYLWASFAGFLTIRQGGPLLCCFTGLMLFHGLPEEAPLLRWRSPARRLMLYLGETSYAVYMGHAFIENGWLTISRKLGLVSHDNIVVLGLILVVSIQGLAMLLHHAIEEPARRRLRRVRFAREIPRVAETAAFST